MLVSTLTRVYSRPGYVFLTVGIAALTMSVLLLAPNQALLATIFTSATISWTAKFSFFISLHGTLLTSFTWFTGAYTVLIALLLGINVSLLWFYIARSRRLSRSDRTLTLTGIGGFVSGIFGVGCAACGTIILTGVLKLFGITWLLTYLPLHGAEFGVIGVILLAITTYTLAKRIADPVTCPV